MRSAPRLEFCQLRAGLFDFRGIFGHRQEAFEGFHGGAPVALIRLQRAETERHVREFRPQVVRLSQMRQGRFRMVRGFGLSPVAIQLRQTRGRVGASRWAASF